MKRRRKPGVTIILCGGGSARLAQGGELERKEQFHQDRVIRESRRSCSYKRYEVQGSGGGGSWSAQEGKGHEAKKSYITKEKQKAIGGKNRVWRPERAGREEAQAQWGKPKKVKGRPA